MNSKVRSLTVKSIVSVCLGLALVASVSAQTASQPTGQPGKVAVIYFQGAIVGTKDGQKAAAELESKATPKRKELELKQNDLNTLQDQLTKGQNTLSDAAKNELYKTIEIKKKALQRDFEDTKEDIDQEQQKLLQQLPQKMTAVIERYSRDHFLGELLQEFLLFLIDVFLGVLEIPLQRLLLDFDGFVKLILGGVTQSVLSFGELILQRIEIVLRSEEHTSEL